MSIDVVRSYVARLMNGWETSFFQLRRPQREGDSCDVLCRCPPGQECPDGYNHVAIDLDYYSPQFQLDQNMWPHHKEQYRVCDLRIEKRASIRALRSTYGSASASTSSDTMADSEVASLSTNDGRHTTFGQISPISLYRTLARPIPNNWPMGLLLRLCLCPIQRVYATETSPDTS